MGGCGRATKRLFRTWLEFGNVNSSARDPQRPFGVLASSSESRRAGALRVDGPTRSAEWSAPGEQIARTQRHQMRSRIEKLQESRKLSLIPCRNEIDGQDGR
jgi:hypothetical protein